MTGNPKSSMWRSAKQEQRKRPKVTVTLDPDYKAKLEDLARQKGWAGLGDVIEHLVDAYEDTHPSVHLKSARKR